MSCHVMSCHVMSRHVMSCHVMSCQQSFIHYIIYKIKTEFSLVLYISLLDQLIDFLGFRTTQLIVIKD